MHHNIIPTGKAVVWLIEQHGYRVCVGDDAGLWIATAKRDRDNQLHTVKAPTECEAVAALAESVGIDLVEG